jgi:hypothetical protein
MVDIRVELRRQQTSHISDLNKALRAGHNRGDECSQSLLGIPCLRDPSSMGVDDFDRKTDSKRKASTTTDYSFSGGALPILPESGHEQDASGHQCHAGDVTEQFPSREDLLSQYEERNYGDPEQIHDARHEE